MSLLVVGSVAFDSVRNRFGSVEKALGGSAVYFASAASMLTQGRKPLHMVGVVGDDYDMGRLDYLERRDVRLNGLEVAAGKTFFWEGEYDDELSEARSLATHLNVFEGFDPKLSDEHEGAEVVFLANIAPELQLKVRRRIRRPRFVGLDSMNFWMRPESRPRLLEVIRNVDVLFLNEKEIETLTGLSDPLYAAEAALDLGVPRVVVKQGARGAFLFGHDCFVRVPAFRTHARDTTGAGDSFAAGFMATVGIMDATHHPETFPLAMVNGTILASFAVEDFSVRRLAALTREEFQARRHTFVESLPETLHRRVAPLVVD